MYIFTICIKLRGCPIFETAIPVATIDAYLATDYQVNAKERFILNVGRPSSELVRWFQVNKENQAVFITAWNPFGEPVPESTNRIAEKKLIAEIKARDLSYLTGESKDPSGLWPSEPSLLVFGILLESAKALVKRYNQDGFVYVGNDSIPQLILLR